MQVKVFKKGSKIVAGVDEAGRGPLAGPVFAAAVILPQDFSHELLNDSKRVSEKNRYILAEYIRNRAVSWAIAMVDCKTIDRINILKATYRAMHLALSLLEPKPDYIIVDGNRFEQFGSIPYEVVVGGDGIYAQIAAASILAKTSRDQYMIKLSKSYPQYKWAKNKGYGTAEHRAAILQYGLSPYHRKSFCSFYFQRQIEFKPTKGEE